MKVNQNFIFLSILFIAFKIINCPHEKNEIIEITTINQLENILTKSQGPVIVSLYMKHCGWCKKMHPLLCKLSCDERFKKIAIYQANAHELIDETSDPNTPTISTEDIIAQTVHEKVPGYPFILFLDKGKYISKQLGGIIMSPEEKQQGLSEYDILAQKIIKSFPHAILPKSSPKSSLFWFYNKCNCK